MKLFNKTCMGALFKSVLDLYSISVNFRPASVSHKKFLSMSLDYDGPS